MSPSIALPRSGAGRRRLALPDHLPRLEGLRGRIVGWIYQAFAALTLAIVAAGLGFNALDLFRNVPADAAYGFGTFTNTSTSGNLVMVLNVSAGATALGLQPNDRIVAVDGAPIEPNASEFDIGAKVARGGDVLTLAVRKDDSAPVRTVRLPRVGNGWGEIEPQIRVPIWFYSGFLFLAEQTIPSFLLVASLLMFRRRPRDPEAMLFAFAFLLMTYNSAYLWWFSLVTSFSIRWICFVALTVAWYGFFLAITGFPDGRFVSRGARLLAALIPFVALAHPAWAVLVPGQAGDFQDVLLSIVFGVAAFASVAALVQRYLRTPSGPERQQIKWAVLGFCATAMTFVVYLPTPIRDAFASMPQPTLFLVGNTLTLVLWIAPAAGLLVSQLRYRLYDADAAISRSVAYGVLTVVLLAIFAGSEKIIEVLGERYFGETLGALAGGLGAAIAAVLIVPLHHRFSHWAEKRFQKNLIHLRHGLPLVVGDLRETAALGDIADAVMKRVERGVRATRVALIVEGAAIASRHVDTGELERWMQAWSPAAHEGLDCVRGDHLFPMRVPLEADGCGRVGWLLLGPRPDGSFYGKDEREAIGAIADPVARAIAIVRQRDTRHAAFETRIGALEAMVARLLKRRERSPAG